MKKHTYISTAIFFVIVLISILSFVFVQKKSETSSVKISNQRSALISKFLENPTIENFIQTCTLSKNIEGNTSKWVLDDNRENMITVKQSLYYDEGMADCLALEQEKGDGYLRLLPLNDNSLVSFENDDTDEQRKAKIDFNNQVKRLISTTKIKFAIFSVNEGVFSPAEWFKKDGLRYRDYSFQLRELGGYFKY